MQTCKEDDSYKILCPWKFIHSDEFVEDIIIEEVEEIYSTTEGQENETRLYSCSCMVEEEDDESDIHEQKFMLRFLSTNTNEDDRYLWVNEKGDVRTDGSYSNLATFFEVIHWMPVKGAQDLYQILCYGGAHKNYILYMDGSSLKTRPYNHVTDDHDITTKFQMIPRGTDTSVQAFISKTGIALYFDEEGDFKPEGPPNPGDETGLQPLFFIIANVRTMRVTSV